MRRTLGKHLKVGDTVEVWWHSGRDTILALAPYHGPLAYLWEAQGGALLATFALNKVGMTIDPGERFTVIASSPRPAFRQTPVQGRHKTETKKSKGKER